MSVNICLVIPSANTIGRNTHIVVSVDANIAPDTCLAPYTLALAALIPFSLILDIFSITTILLSTNIPTPRDKPDKLIMFKVILLKYISTIDTNKLIGILSAIIIVGLKLFKNTNKTIIANAPPTIKLSKTLSIIISIYIPWSINVVILTLSFSFIISSIVLPMFLVTSVVDDTLDFCKDIITPSLPFILAYVSSELSTLLISATSFK